MATKSTPWAVLDPADLSISVVVNPPKGQFAIPMDRVNFRDGRGAYDDLFRSVHFGTVYTLHAETKPATDRKQYTLIGPDPWMLAITAIIWEGLLPR